MTISFALITQLRKVLFIIAGVAIVGLMITVIRFQPWQEFNVMTSHDAPSEDQNASWASTILQPESEEQFKSKVDVFSVTMPASTSAEQATMSPSGQLPENIRVVAVMRGAQNTVVVEDTSQSKTYFLTEKNPDGDFTLLSVDAQRAILMYQGQTIEVVF